MRILSITSSWNREVDKELTTKRRGESTWQGVGIGDKSVDIMEGAMEGIIVLNKIE